MVDAAIMALFTKKSCSLNHRMVSGARSWSRGRRFKSFFEIVWFIINVNNIIIADIFTENVKILQQDSHSHSDPENLFELQLLKYKNKTLV